MSKLFLIFAMSVCAVAAQAAPAANLTARIHFLGGDEISRDTNSAAFTNELCSAEARALEGQTLDKLAHAPYTWFKSKIAGDAGDGAAQLRPLLDDLLKAEWFLEVRNAADGSPEFALAIRLDDNRARLWQENLAAVLESWTKIPTQKIAGGWQLAKHHPPEAVRIVRNGGWTVFSCEQGDFSLGNGAVEDMAATPLKNSWLSVDADWSLLAKLFPALKLIDLPETRLQVTGQGGDLHLDGKLISPEPFALTLEKWRMPTNIIHQPFASFTAARGIAPWLQRQSWAQPYLIAPVPNQVFIWALALVPFQTFAAVPVPDANAALDQLHNKMAANPVNPQSQLFMQIHMSMTNHEISWTGAPFAQPSVRAEHGSAGDFLFGGLFPNIPRSKPLPPELFTALAPANLVYYHWETTSERLKLLLQPAQLAFLLSQHKQFDSESAAGKWLNHIGPTLGSTVTEITQTAPNELTFTRRAPGGLTALEFFALANWLEAANFPSCDLRIPPPRARPNLLPKKTLSAPGTPAPH